MTHRDDSDDDGGDERRGRRGRRGWRDGDLGADEDDVVPALVQGHIQAWAVGAAVGDAVDQVA